MQKNAIIIGDSYSTFKGYIPENYLYYYGGDEDWRPKLDGVEKTWWHRLTKKTGLTLLLSDSYSGSSVCNTVREGYPIDSSFIRRLDRMLDTGFFDEAVDEWLVQNGKYIDLLSLDCTKGDKESPYYGHMSMSEGKAIADRFKAKGLIDEQTLLYYTHFSHCCEMVYDDLQAVAKEKYGFEVAFDGLKVGI